MEQEICKYQENKKQRIAFMILYYITGFCILLGAGSVKSAVEQMGCQKSVDGGKHNK